MSKHYSPSTGGFYADDVHDVIPSDAIALTDEQYGALLAGVNSGSVISVVDGVPTLTARTISLDEVKATKIVALRAACAAAIVGGFTSSALGTAHTYPSAQTDQINLMGSVTASLLPGVASDWSTMFWCRDEAGAWSYVAHTAAQIQAAGGDGKAHVVDCQSRLASLSAEVEAATTVDAVTAIVWA